MRPLPSNITRECAPPGGQKQREVDAVRSLLVAPRPRESRVPRARARARACAPRTRLGFPSFPTAKPGTKTSEFVATDSLVFVPGFAVGKLGNPKLRLALP